MLALFLRDLKLSFRAGGGALIGILFFLAVISVMPFGVGPDLNLLARIGPAMLWIGALLATLLGLDRLFQADREDGSLDLLLIGADRHMPALTVFVKCVAHWVSSVLPLVISAPMLGLFMNMDAAAIGATALTLRWHACHCLYRRGWRCLGGLASARWPARFGHRAAAHHSGADFWCFCLLWRNSG